jgi:hypothetical protein
MRHRSARRRRARAKRGFPAAALLAGLLVAATAGPAAALTVLTTGKVALSKDGPGEKDDRAVFRFGKDPALAAIPDPACPALTTVQVASYSQATWRVVAQPGVELPCDAWRRVAGGWMYTDRAALHGGVTRIVYTRTKLLIKLRGPGFLPVTGPVGYLEVWLGIGTERYLGRFHSFVRNDASVIRTRKPSVTAAAGEAAFWDVLHGVDPSAARQEEAIALLDTAARRNRRDGRSGFLLAMMHLYRFGQATTDFGAVSEFARGEVAAAHVAFEQAVPLLWDGTAGDSRVPGFAAATKYVKGLVEGDDALRDAGIADLAAAVAVNQFFNVFDYIPVAQAVPASDPLFATVFAEVDDYLSDPDTLACIGTQPEICGNLGLAPHNAEGAVLLFGDLYAKAGDLPQAQTWYELARALGAAGARPWQFQAVAEDRAATAAARVALYQDADPANDPPVIGAGEEACAVCHYR